MLNCQQTAELISEGLDRKLSWRKRIGLRFHLLMCGACTMYCKQVRWLHRLFRARYADASGLAEQELETRCPDEVKRRISETLREKLGGER